MKYLFIFCGSSLAASYHYSNSNHKKHRGNHSSTKKRFCQLCHRESLTASYLQGEPDSSKGSDESHVVFPSRTKFIYAYCPQILQREHKPVTIGLIDLQQLTTMIHEPKRKFSHLDWKRYHRKCSVQGKILWDIVTHCSSSFVSQVSKTIDFHINTCIQAE